MNRQDVLPCGCYADAIPEDDRMRWLRWPNSFGGLVLVNETVGREIEKLGEITVNGVRATVSREQDGCPHEFRLWFDGRWSRSHPGPHADPSYGLAA